MEKKENKKELFNDSIESLNIGDTDEQINSKNLTR